MSYQNQPILGFRSWRMIEPKPRVKAAVFEYIWEPGVNHFKCESKEESNPLELGPHEEHDCGFNAYFETDQDLWFYHHQDSIDGAIIAAGKTMMHETGFRAEQAQIIAFLYPDQHRDHAEKIAAYYRVPIFESCQELLDYSKDFGVYIPETNDLLLEVAKKDNSSWEAMVSKPDSKDDQPSVVSDYESVWYKDRVLHRDNDRPATIFSADGWLELEWWRDGKLHRENDEPAIVIYDSWGNIDKIEYYKDGVLHREGDLPAAIWANGDKEYWVRGKYGRSDGLATSGTKEVWVKDGKRHRSGDLPAITEKDGSQEWWSEGSLHRDGDRPAKIYANGHKEWWVEGKRHRSNGLPAVLHPKGNSFLEEIWEHGVLINTTNKETKPSAEEGMITINVPLSEIEQVIQNNRQE